jgi:hypothetical protein
MSEEKFLHTLSPPSGGWQRLVARRDAPRGEGGLGWPLATAAALALVVFFVRPPTRELQLSWESARLTDQPSEGIGLKQVNGAKATALPSSDPHVHFYWVQDERTLRQEQIN